MAEAHLALVVLVAHRTNSTAEGWVKQLATRGHMALQVDPEDLPDRPAVLDAVVVDPSYSATAVEALRRWVGGNVVVRLSDDPPDEDWLNELVRTSGAPLTLGGMAVDLRRGLIQRDDQLVTLTDTEALLLAWLATQTGSVVSRADLLKNVWGYSPNMRTRVVDVTIARLRTKIEVDPAHPERIVTVRGKGYRLDGVTVGASPEVSSALPESGLLGRQSTWHAMHRWLDKGDRLLTLLGPPGIGKTAIATAFAAAVPGSVWCGLQPATTEDEALALLSEALGMPGLSEEQVRKAVLHGERALLVLDNAEHLPGLVGRLLTAVPVSPVLITSRVRTGAPDERCLDLDPLTPSDTEALFLRRARELRQDFVGSPDELLELATLCEGLPLAVELAAAQVRVLSASDLVRVLSRRDVRSSRRTGHKSYDDALASSWALLGPDERELLALLASIRGDAPLTLIEGVFDEPLEALSALRDASLLQIRHPPAGSIATLLETVRRHVLRTAPLDDAANLGLTRAIAGHVADLDRRARGPEGWSAVRDLGRLRPAIWGAVEQAVSCGESELAATLGLSLTHFYETLGPDAPDLGMLRRIGSGGTFPSAFRVAQLRALVLSRSGHPDEAGRQATYASELAESPEQCASAVYTETMLALRDRKADLSALEAVLDDLDDVGRYRAYGCLAVFNKIHLKLDAAIGYFEKALAIADRTGAGWMETNVLGLLASVYGNAGQWERAAATADALVEKLDKAGFSRRSELSLQLQRVTRQGLGDLEGAISLQRELITLMGAQGRLWHQGRLSTSLSFMYLDQGSPKTAAEAAREAERFFRAAEDDTGVGHGSAALASALLALGQVDRACELASPQLRSEEPEARDLALEVMVYASLGAGDVARAAEVLGEGQPSEAMGALLAAALAAVQGVPCEPPPAQAGRFGHRSALAALLGGPEHVPRTDREQAVCTGVVRGGPYPETLVVAALRRTD